MKGPEGTITKNNSWHHWWLATAVLFSDHWWLPKAINVDAGHQDVKVEFLHPHRPTANAHPKHGRRDVCFCRVKDFPLKLTGMAFPLLSSRTRELYSAAPDITGFIQRGPVWHPCPMPKSYRSDKNEISNSTDLLYSHRIENSSVVVTGSPILTLTSTLNSLC